MAARLVCRTWGVAFAVAMGTATVRGPELRRAVRSGVPHATGVRIVSRHERDTAFAWQWSAVRLWGDRDCRLHFTGPKPTPVEVTERLHGQPPRFRGFDSTARWALSNTVTSLEICLDGATYGRRGLSALKHILDVPWPALTSLRLSAIEECHMQMQYKDYRGLLSLVTAIVRQAPKIQVISADLFAYHARERVLVELLSVLRERPLEHASFGLRRPAHGADVHRSPWTIQICSGVVVHQASHCTGASV